MAEQIEILGAYFPGWLLSAIAGVVLAAAGKGVLRAIGLDSEVWLPALFYPSLALLFAGGIWLVLFE